MYGGKRSRSYVSHPKKSEYKFQYTKQTIKHGASWYGPVFFTAVPIVFGISYIDSRIVLGIGLGE